MTAMRHFFFGEEFELDRDLPLDVARRFLDRKELAKKAGNFSKYPIDDILGILERVGKRLVDPAGPYRGRILELMPEVTGFSEAMVEKGVEILEGLMSRSFLKRRLSCLGSYRALDSYVRTGRGRAVRALPLGSICHVAAGNIFLGSIDSLVLGIITKNVNVLKISRQDPIFPFIFLDALRDVDVDGVILPHIAMTSWSHSNRVVMDRVKENFDGILLFGGEEAVKSYSQGVGPSTEVLAFGPKVSWGLVRGEMDEDDLREAARGFAMDVTLWEQRACTSCQNIFVEGDGDRFAGMLAEELELLAESYPQRSISLDEAVEIRREREMAFWRETQGKSSLREGGSYTVISQRDRNVHPSPLNRTVYVNSVECYDELLEGNLAEMGPYMSTVAVAVPEEKMKETVECLSSLKVFRFCRPGIMGLGADDSAPHDGVHIPLSLVRLVNREDISQDTLGPDYDEPKIRDARLLAHLNDILAEAMKSSFYHQLYSDVDLPLRSLEEFSRLPFLEKSHLEAHSPPDDLSLLTAEAKDCYFFSSGGTTGKARYICWSADEFRASGRVLGDGFRPLGITAEDRVANMLRAGALWTGFLAVNKGLEETGCQILSVTSNQDDEDTLAYFDTFHPTAVMAMSSALVQLARAAERTGWGGSIEKIYYTGEALPPAAQEYLRRIFSCTVIASLSYGAVEIGPMGYQCSHCAHNEFHVVDDWCYVEILDDGELVGTTINRHLHPIIRYRLGDRAEWVDEPCSCGRRTPRFRLLGRMNDFVRLHFNDLYLDEIHRALDGFPELSSDFQVRVDSDGTDLKLRILVETMQKIGKNDASKVAEDVRRAVMKEASQFQEVENMGCSEFSVDLVSAGTIERISRTGKIRRIVDRRVDKR